jgi:hypothetical protein
MFEKIIEFSSHEAYVELNSVPPVPIKSNIPDWFKKLTHTHEKLTVKGCMPFLDTLTSGYLLKIAMDIKIKHNVFNTDIKEMDSYYSTGRIDNLQLDIEGININRSKPSSHPPDQLEGSPLLLKNKNLSFYKIHNPWIIKTPPGYSCLFLPPLNNTDDRFSIVPGIVDTDTYKMEVNFPIIINGDKYPTLDTVLKKGTPYVQIIPFKRDSWKMKIIKKSSTELKKQSMFFGLDLINVYKNNFWKKKSWN